MSTTWETIEERERRVRGTRTTSAMLRAGDQVPAGNTLKSAFAERYSSAARTYGASLVRTMSDR